MYYFGATIYRKNITNVITPQIILRFYPGAEAEICRKFRNVSLCTDSEEILKTLEKKNLIKDKL